MTEVRDKFTETIFQKYQNSEREMKFVYPKFYIIKHVTLWFLVSHFINPLNIGVEI